MYDISVSNTKSSCNRLDHLSLKALKFSTNKKFNQIIPYCVYGL